MDCELVLFLRNLVVVEYAVKSVTSQAYLLCAFLITSILVEGSKIGQVI